MLFFTLILSRVINLNKLLALSSLGNILGLISRNILSLKLIFLFIIIYIYMLLGIYIFYNKYYYNIFTQINRINYFDKILIVIFCSLILLYHYISRIYFFLTLIPLIKLGFRYINNSWLKYIYLISLMFFIFNFIIS